MNKYSLERANSLNAEIINLKKALDCMSYIKRDILDSQNTPNLTIFKNIQMESTRDGIVLNEGYVPFNGCSRFYNHIVYVIENELEVFIKKLEKEFEEL